MTEWKRISAEDFAKAMKIMSAADPSDRDACIAAIEKANELVGIPSKKKRARK